jgi:hypothetical protein
VSAMIRRCAFPTNKVKPRHVRVAGDSDQRPALEFNIETGSNLRKGYIIHGKIDKTEGLQHVTQNEEENMNYNRSDA